MHSQDDSQSEFSAMILMMSNLEIAQFLSAFTAAHSGNSIYEVRLPQFMNCIWPFYTCANWISLRSVVIAKTNDLMKIFPPNCLFKRLQYIWLLFGGRSIFRRAFFHSRLSAFYCIWLEWSGHNRRSFRFTFVQKVNVWTAALNSICLWRKLIRT